MYSIEQEKEFLQLAKQFQTTEINENDLAIVRDIIEYADWKYYVQDNPVLADLEYDILFKKLKIFEEQNPIFITLSSPTQRVAKGLNTSFSSVAHLVPMLSLENSYNAEDLLDWDRKCRELSGEATVEYCVEPKFDGASISLVYENDIFTRGATRGNGTEGDDITINTKQIRSIPIKAAISKYNLKQIEIRGEVVITKNRFE